MKYCYSKKIFSFVLLALIFMPAAVGHAQSGPLVPCGTSASSRACTICDFALLIINIVNFLVKDIAIPLAGLMIVVGGIMIMTGAASEERVRSGKKVLTNAIIGIVIVFVSWLFVDTVIKVLTGNISNFNTAIGNFGPWNAPNANNCPF